MRDEPLPSDLQEGDFIYIRNAGAYTTAYASEFNGFPLPEVRVFESEALGPFVQHEVEPQAVGAGLRLPLRFAPGRRSKCGKARVALVVALDLGEHQPVGDRQRRGIEFAAADHEDDRFAGAQRERTVERRRDAGAGRVDSRRCA